MNIKSEKNLCAWGLVSMILLSNIPLLGIIFSFGGLAAYVLGIIGLSNKLNNSEISKNYLISLVIYITTIVIGVGIAFLLGISTSRIPVADYSLSPLFTAGIIILIFYVGFVAASFFEKKYLEIISKETKYQAFDLAGKIIFWGTILFFIPSIIGRIIQIYAFFKVPENIESQNQ